MDVQVPNVHFSTVEIPGVGIIKNIFTGTFAYTP